MSQNTDRLNWNQTRVTRWVAAALSAVALQVSLSAAFPKPDGYVNDFAGILDPPTKAALQAALTTLEHDTSAEVVVATVKSLDGMSVEDRPVTIPDLLGTVCQTLRIDPSKSNISNVGRPIRIVDPIAQPLKEIVG